MRQILVHDEGNCSFYMSYDEIVDLARAAYAAGNEDYAAELINLTKEN